MQETLPISNIIIKERQRKSQMDVEDLMDSIKRYGLIHPIVVDASDVLLAGERRLTACKGLGWNEVPIRRFGELSVIEQKEIEIEENIRRKALEWQEEVAAKAELHELKRSLYGEAYPGQSSGWKVADTANALGESVGNTSMDIQVAKALKTFPQLANAKSKTRAYHQLKQMVDNVVRGVLAEEAPKVMDNDEGFFDLRHGDCVEEIQKLPAECIDLIITDPPYGVDLDKNTIGSAYVSTYEDSFDDWIKLIGNILPELYRVLKEGAHMYIFFASQHYTPMRTYIAAAGFNFDPTPCIWYKGHMRANPASPQKRFRYVYETFFFCWKGNQRLLSHDDDAVFDIPSLVGQEKVHLAEKPFDLGKQLCELSSVKNEVVLDVFAGSGSLIYPAYKLGRKVIGIEKKKEFYDMLITRFNYESPTVST